MSLPALKDLFARHRERATGHWRLGQDPQRTVYLEHGDVVFAASTHPLDRLTHLLVERGRITQAQLDYAMANLNPSMSIGKNLIEMGFITQRDLLDVARAQVERVVWAVLAHTEEAPVFEARDLETNTVRLPFDTPLMLLTGVLNLRDRETLLDVLGPLNQVVVLETKRLQEMTLPSDLAKLPLLLDGSRTLLELSRESGVEPFRLGAFALFLREMGWARLHELPPLDRRALELALEPSQPPLTPPLPDPAPETQPSLFSEIHASQQPTTNLEHLSQSLDQLGPEDEVPEQAPILAPPPPPEPPLQIQHEAEGFAVRNEPVALPAASSKRPLVLAVVALLALGVWGGLRFFPRKSPALSKSSQEPVKPASKPVAKPPMDLPKPEAAAPTQATESKPEVQVLDQKAEAKPEPKSAPGPKAPPSFARSDRMQAIQKGDWNLAVSQGALYREKLQGKWTLRLEIACQGETVQHATELLKSADPDVFILPMVMRDGRTCYQVFLGSYGSEAAAKSAAKGLPTPFLAEGNRPKTYRVTEIPDRQ